MEYRHKKREKDNILLRLFIVWQSRVVASLVTLLKIFNLRKHLIKQKICINISEKIHLIYLKGTCLSSRPCLFDSVKAKSPAAASAAASAAAFLLPAANR